MNSVTMEKMAETCANTKAVGKVVVCLLYYVTHTLLTSKQHLCEK